MDFVETRNKEIVALTRENGNESKSSSTTCRLQSDTVIINRRLGRVQCQYHNIGNVYNL